MSNHTEYFRIVGELEAWPSQEGMAAILRAHGLGGRVGRYSIRIDACPDFTFEEYGGDIAEPTIEAATESLEEMTRQGGLVSAALAAANLRHRFEIYDEADKLVGYLHHQWPLID